MHKLILTLSVTEVALLTTESQMVTKTKSLQMQDTLYEVAPLWPKALVQQQGL